MSSNPGEATEEKTPGQTSQTADLDPEQAYELYHDQDLSYREIGERTGVSKDTARRRVKDFERGLDRGVEQGRNEALSSASSNELQDALSDRLTDDDEFHCQNCQSKVDFLQSQCGSCGTVLNWGAIGGGDDQ